MEITRMTRFPTLFILASVMTASLGACTQYDAGGPGPGPVLSSYDPVPIYEEPVVRRRPPAIRRGCPGGYMQGGEMICPSVARAARPPLAAAAPPRFVPEPTTYSDPAAGGGGGGGGGGSGGGGGGGGGGSGGGWH
jgi:uncharacterized membrane protein YgcG